MFKILSSQSWQISNIYLMLYNVFLSEALQIIKIVMLWVCFEFKAFWITTKFWYCIQLLYLCIMSNPTLNQNNFVIFFINGVCRAVAVIVRVCLNEYHFGISQNIYFHWIGTELPCPSVYACVCGCVVVWFCAIVKVLTVISPSNSLIHL